MNVQRWSGGSWRKRSSGTDNAADLDWNVPIYAPASSVIASCWQNSPDNPRIGEKLDEIGSTIFTGGNHVVILTDGGHAISLNHFRKGTVPDGLCPSNDDGTHDVPTMAKIGDLRAAAFIDAADRPRVTEGQLVGRVGNSGNSDGPHLHWSIQEVQSVDPTTGAISLGPAESLRIRDAWAQGFASAHGPAEDDWFRYRGHPLTESFEPRNKTILASPYLRRVSAGAGAVAPDLDVAFLTSLRVVTGSISQTDGTAKLIVWDTIGKSTLNRRGDFELGAAKELKFGLISSTSFLVALRQADNRLKVIAFQVAPTGQLVRRDDRLAGEISALDMTTTRGPSKRAVTAVCDAQGRLRLIAWAKNGSADGSLEVERLGQAVGPEISALAVASAGNFKGVLAAARVNGSLKLLPWRMTGNGGGFAQGASASAGVIGPELDVARLAGGVAASMIDGAGRLRIITWKTSPDGDIVGPRKGKLTAHRGNRQVLLQSPAAGSNLTSVMRGSDGLLYLIGWAVDDDGSRLGRLGSSKAGAIKGQAADAVIRSFAAFDPREFTLTAVIDSSDALKLISWDTNLELP